jgi:hypothetical protein
VPAQRPTVRTDPVGPAGGVAALGFLLSGLLAALPALERFAHAVRSTLLCEDPGTLTPRRLVPHVLAVAAGQ